LYNTDRISDDEEAPLIAKDMDEPTVGCCDKLRGREDIIYCDNGARSSSSMLGVCTPLPIISYIECFYLWVSSVVHMHNRTVHPRIVRGVGVFVWWDI
jgi:hypothetical protein